MFFLDRKTKKQMFSCRRCIKIVKDAKKGSSAARWNFDTSSTAWEYVENKWIYFSHCARLSLYLDNIALSRHNQI